MRTWQTSIWIAGLLLAALASWLLWSFMPEIRVGNFSRDLHFLISLLPLAIWASLPVVFWNRLSRSTGMSLPATVQAQRRDVVAFLSARGLRGRRARYSLPFFLLAGPHSSGKTSLLERADMKLGPPKTIGNATWWVGPDAVFIETSLGQGDALPLDVFDLLCSLRPKLPVNATLLVTSPADLTLADHAEQQMIIQAVADTLRRLDEMTGASVPTYLVLSKTDLVPGFREFFDRYEAQEREQPWGFVLPYETMAAAERLGEIDKGFHDILEAMRVRHMEWLSRESDPVRCGHIHGFAAQIAIIRKTIAPMLDKLTPENDHGWHGALLRGIFLTSARQEPLSIDALLPEMSRRFAMPRSGMLPPDLGLDEEDSGYFIGGILKKAVLPEAGLVLHGMRRDSGVVAQWVAVATIMLATAGISYWTFKTLDREFEVAGRVNVEAAHIRPAVNPARMDDLAKLVQSLEGLRKIRQDVAGQEQLYRHAIWLSARAPLDGALSRAERDLRVKALAVHLGARLEAALVEMDVDAETLRKRVEIALAAGDASSPLLMDWLADEARAFQGEKAAVLLTQGTAAIREAGGLAVDAAYIDAARRIIAYKESLS